MATKATAGLAAVRLALLARVAAEGRRGCGDDQARACNAYLLDIEEGARDAARKAAGTLTQGAGLSGAGARAATETGGSAVQQVQRERARLELELNTARQELGDAQKALRKEQGDHREAVASLTLQRKRLDELQKERGTLLEQMGDMESKLVESQNEAERAKLQYEKLKSSRQLMGDHATQLTEQMNDLKAENDRLRAEREAALQERDRLVKEAESRAEHFRGESEDVAFRALWQTMSENVPQVFTDTHVPDRSSFEHVCDVMTILVQMLANLEQHVHQKLKDYRNVDDRGDKLNRVYNMFKATPGILDTMRDYITTGNRRNNFVNLRRAIQAWVQAFASGPHKAIVRSPGVVEKELNYRQWPINVGMVRGEDAAIGQYFKQTARREIPSNVGNAMRKEAADFAFEDYNELLRARL